MTTSKKNLTGKLFQITVKKEAQQTEKRLVSFRTKKGELKQVKAYVQYDIEVDGHMTPVAGYCGHAYFGKIENGSLIFE